MTTVLSSKPDGWETERRRIEDSEYWVSPAGRRRRWRSTAFRVGLMLFNGTMRMCGLYARGRRNALAPRLVELTLHFPTLPQAFDGYRILHLTDTHLDALPELADVAREMLSGVEVDALALTGDVLGDQRASLAAATVPLACVLEPVSVREHRLAVLGNHDPATMADALEQLGFEVLLNRSIEVERGDDRVVFIGLDDVHSFYTDRARIALSDPGASGFRIALIHSPEMADYASVAGVALYLCGHTHGGQVCLPHGRPLVTQLTRCRRASRGLWRCGATTGYTSSGLGTSWPPLRYNSRGEMTVITLRVG